MLENETCILKCSVLKKVVKLSVFCVNKQIIPSSAKGLLSGGQFYVFGFLNFEVIIVISKFTIFLLLFSLPASHSLTYLPLLTSSSFSSSSFLFFYIYKPVLVFRSFRIKLLHISDQSASLCPLILYFNILLKLRKFYVI